MKQKDSVMRKSIRRITVVSALFIAGLLVICSCVAKPKVYKVGILSGLDFFAATADSFKEKMTELGYTEGKNIEYDLQKMNVDFDAYKAALKKFVDAKVDLIFVFPTEASLEAKAAVQGTKIPVLFAQASTEGVNLVNSIKEPGGNITGVRYPGVDFAVKRFEVLMQIAPKAKRVWITFLEGYPIVGPELENLRPIAEKAGVTLIELPVKSPADIQADLDKRSKLKDIGIDAMLIIPEPLTATPDIFAIMGKFAYEHKIPVGGALVIAGDYATLFGVSAEDSGVGKQAALMADKIFKGTAAGTIPVASPEYFIQINYKMAQKMGIEIPEALLTSANEVIK